MRVGGSIVLALLLPLGCGRDEPPEPIGELIWIAGGGSDCHLEMYRGGERIEFRGCGHHAVATLTPAGVSAWDDAVASVDPAVIPDLPRCAPVDGIDICFDLEGNGDLFAMCYCVLDTPPPEVAELDAYLGGLVMALHGCESSEHVVIDLCDRS